MNDRDKAVHDKNAADSPANIYLFKVNNNKARKRCKICSKSTIQTAERRHWQNKTKSIAVKYVKKYESLEETSLIWGYGLCSTLGDMSHFSYTNNIRIPKIRIRRAK